MAKVVKEMWAELPARVGLLTEVADAIATAGANIEGMVAYEMDGKGSLTFVTSDNETAMQAAKTLGAEVGEADVVVIDLANEPGALADATEKIAAAGINIEYAYGSTCGCGSAAIYIKCDDAAGAVAALG